MDKILEGLVSSSHPLPLKRVIVRRVVESAETPLSQAQCRAMFALGTRLVLQGLDPFQRQVGRQVLDAYGRFHRAEFEAFFNRGLVLGLLQRGYGELSNRDPAILDYIQAGLRLIMSCPSVLELFELLQVEALRLVCERPAPPLCARLCQLLGDFPQCLPRGRKLSLAFCQQLVRSIAHFQSQGTREAELRLYVSQVTQVSALLRSVWKAEPDTLLPSLQELFAVISAAGERERRGINGGVGYPEKSESLSASGGRSAGITWEPLLSHPDTKMQLFDCRESKAFFIFCPPPKGGVEIVIYFAAEQDGVWKNSGCNALNDILK